MLQVSLSGIELITISFSPHENSSINIQWWDQKYQCKFRKRKYLINECWWTKLASIDILTGFASIVLPPFIVEITSFHSSHLICQWLCHQILISSKFFISNITRKNQTYLWQFSYFWISNCIIVSKNVIYSSICPSYKQDFEIQIDLIFCSFNIIC